MRNGIRDGFAIVMCSAIAALVHPTSAVGQQKPDTGTAAVQQMPETVLTGCLKSHGADTQVAGPSGRLYTLEVVETVMASGAPTAGAEKPATASSTTYSLSVNKAAAKGIDLEKHADHQVQLTGRLQAPSTAATPTPGSPQSAAKTTPVAGGAHRTFEVSGVKMVSAKCG